MSNSPKTPRANPILIGKAEEIDLLLPAVRQMMERQGIYLASDTERPGWTVPLAVNAEGLWSMQLDSRLNPERFKDTVQIAGPFYAPGEEVESAAHSTHTAALGIDLAALRARVVSAIERITSGTGQMRVPADLTDPDLVLADVLTLLDALDPHCTDSPKGGSDARDAARYRWVKAQGLLKAAAMTTVPPGETRIYGSSTYRITGAFWELGSAIDAAMQTQPGDVEVQNG